MKESMLRNISKAGERTKKLPDGGEGSRLSLRIERENDINVIRLE